MGLLVYDGDCGFCTRSARLLRERIRTRDDVRPSQQLELATLGLTAAQAAEAVQHVADDGTVTSGARAIAATLRAAPQPWAAAGRVLDAPPVRPLAALGYRLVAANRHRLPGSTDRCAP